MSLKQALQEEAIWLWQEFHNFSSITKEKFLEVNAHYMFLLFLKKLLNSKLHLVF